MRLVVAGFALLLAACSQAEDEGVATEEVTSASRITWSGHEWLVKYGDNKSPGNNAWRTDNVFVDAGGALHLRIAKDANGRWACAEITSTESFGWGTYRFEVEGRLDQLPPSAVLGFFNYPRAGTTHDATSEIDVEFAQWGKATADRGNFTVWGAGHATDPLWSESFPVALSGGHTLHSFDWRDGSVRFASRHGHSDTGFPIAERTYAAPRVGTVAKPVHLNFWLFQGTSPTGPLEVVIRRFDYAP